MTVAYGTEVVLPANAFVRPGYRFMGWIDADDVVYAAGDHVDDIDAAGAGAVVLKALWEARVPVLQLDKSAYERGETVTVSGNDFEPGRDVVLTMHSTPVQVATLAAQADGTLAGTFTIPTSLEAGTHELRAENGLHTASISIEVGSAAKGTVTGGQAGMPLTSDGLPVVAAAVVAVSAAATVVAAKKKTAE